MKKLINFKSLAPSTEKLDYKIHYQDPVSCIFEEELEPSYSDMGNFFDKLWREWVKSRDGVWKMFWTFPHKGQGATLQCAEYWKRVATSRGVRDLKSLPSNNASMASRKEGKGR